MGLDPRYTYTVKIDACRISTENPAKLMEVEGGLITPILPMFYIF